MKPDSARVFPIETRGRGEISSQRLCRAGRKRSKPRGWGAEGEKREDLNSKASGVRAALRSTPRLTLFVSCPQATLLLLLLALFASSSPLTYLSSSSQALLLLRNTLSLAGKRRLHPLLQNRTTIFFLFCQPESSDYSKRFDENFHSVPLGPLSDEPDYRSAAISALVVLSRLDLFQTHG